MILFCKNTFSFCIMTLDVNIILMNNFYNQIKGMGIKSD